LEDVGRILRHVRDAVEEGDKVVALDQLSRAKRALEACESEARSLERDAKRKRE
jgi:hypothetical protein